MTIHINSFEKDESSTSSVKKDLPTEVDNLLQQIKDLEAIAVKQ